MQIASDLPIPDLSQAKRILCVQPHYDDNDIGAGGTLAALSDGGVEIIYLTITDDLVGVIDPDLPDDLAITKLRDEQAAAGEIIGVKAHNWLGLPDAGDFNYFTMRLEIIRHIRMLKPDFLMTCDPWLPYEAHLDHIRTGLAVSEASYLHAMVRLKSDPHINGKYRPYEISGVAFYLSHKPNATIDITATRERKHRALDCYRAQFTPQSLTMLHDQIEANERGCAQELPFKFGETLKVLRPEQLHINVHTQKL